MNAANVRSTTFGFLGAGIFWAVAHCGPAVAQIQVTPAFVRLQATTPGTPQTGHSNLSGTLIASQFVGGGAGITGLNASSVSSGTLANARTTGTAANAPNTLVTRDGFGSFAAHQISASSLFAGGATSQVAVTGDTSSSADGATGVYGNVSSASGAWNAGVFGQTESPAGYGVYGNAASSTGFTYGVHGQCWSPDGRAIEGISVSNFGGIGGYFWVQGAAGTAGKFQNEGLGSKYDVDVSGPNGAISTNGFLYRDYTLATPSAAIPVAYGSVAPDGTVNGGTGNFSVTRVSTGVYDVTVNGEFYSNTAFSVTVTPVTSSPRMTGVADAGTPFRVNIWSVSGAVVDSTFQFTIWKGSPSTGG